MSVFLNGVVPNVVLSPFIFNSVNLLLQNAQFPTLETFDGIVNVPVNGTFIKALLPVDYAPVRSVNFVILLFLNSLSSIFVTLFDIVIS